MAISPDGRWLAAGGRDKTLGLWDLTAAEPEKTARVLSGHEDWVNSLAISPNGRWLATGSNDKTVRLWPLRMEELLRQARRAAGRDFSRAEWEELFPGEEYRKTFESIPASPATLPR
jgi:WD40 repeat protein